MHSYFQMLLWILIGLTFIAKTDGFSSGAPLTTCNSMAPLHESSDGFYPPQTTDPPFEVGYERGIEGESITVFLRSTRDTAFAGFMLEARKRDMVDELLGGFFLSRDNNAQILTCNGIPGSAVTQVNNQDKTHIQVQWSPPGAERDVTFRATFVHLFQVFWEKVDLNVTFPQHTTSIPTTIAETTTTMSTTKLTTTGSTAESSTDMITTKLTTTASTAEPSTVMSTTKLTTTGSTAESSTDMITTKLTTTASATEPSTDMITTKLTTTASTAEPSTVMSTTKLTTTASTAEPSTVMSTTKLTTTASTAEPSTVMSTTKLTTTASATEPSTDMITTKLTTTASTAEASNDMSTTKINTTTTTSNPNDTISNCSNIKIYHPGAFSLNAFHSGLAVMKLEMSTIATIINSLSFQYVNKVSKIFCGVTCTVAEIAALVLLCLDLCSVIPIAFICVVLLMDLIELVIVSMPIGPSHELKPMLDLTLNVCSTISEIFTVAVIFSVLWELEKDGMSGTESWLLKTMVAYAVWILLFVIWVFAFNCHIKGRLWNRRIGSSKRNYTGWRTHRQKKKLSKAEAMVIGVSVILIFGTTCFVAAVTVGIFIS